MVFPRARLAAAACLFTGWLLFLLYLVIVTRDAIVVSRPQILVSQLGVRAQIDADDGRPVKSVTVLEVLWPNAVKAELTEKVIELHDLPDLGEAQGWTGPGVYLLALNRAPGEKETAYYLTPLPVMPGFHRTYTAELIDAGKDQDKVADYLQQAFGFKAAQTQQLLGRTPTVLKKFVASDVAYRLKEELAKLGAAVDFTEFETRMYRATDDVIRQVREMKPE